jgi:hypothetical protein
LTWKQKEHSDPPKKLHQDEKREVNTSRRNENIICALLALLREVDADGLELARKEVDLCLDKIKNSSG